MRSPRFHIAVLASGSGSNAEVIFEYFKNHPDISVDLVLTNNPKAFVIERAERSGVPVKTFSKDEFKSSGEVLQWLEEKSITHIVLAGFLWMIPVYLVHAYPNRIINIHPALLPKFGGKGMYGMNVHEAVKAANEKESGITIHLVNEHYDEGQVIFQKHCPLGPDFSPADISACVQKLEHQYYPQVIERWILG